MYLVESAVVDLWSGMLKLGSFKRPKRGRKQPGAITAAKVTSNKVARNRGPLEKRKVELARDTAKQSEARKG
jgi:hypothetical protein